MTKPTPGQGAASRAVLFDLDGTLMDTNYLHVMAWWESFLEQGHQVSGFDIHRAIGRGSSDLVETLLGEPDDAVTKGHEERWGTLRDRALPFHDAAKLVRACHERGLKVVWATSGTPEDVEQIRKVLDVDDAVDAIVNSSDVENSKPAPDIVLAALRAAGVEPDQAVMVGDTVYDVRAAAAAGVRCIGLVGGGISEQELREAGAAAVYGNASELLAGLDSSPLGQG